VETTFKEKGKRKFPEGDLILKRHTQKTLTYVGGFYFHPAMMIARSTAHTESALLHWK
jgi:hypothetical protein